MRDSQFFRAGVGTVIYTDTGEIVLFERADIPGIWQLQQGGIDAGETPEETLWRELKEETGLTQADVTLTHKYPDWLYYEYPPTMRTPYGSNALGQIHRWYFLKLAPNTVIDLAKAVDREFTDFKLSQFTEITANTTHPHYQLKRDVYCTLADYFHTHILPDLPTPLTHTSS